MAGYNPNCERCNKCMTCKGSGTVMVTKSDPDVTKKWNVWKEPATCPTCRGVGGRACGSHP